MSLHPDFTSFESREHMTFQGPKVARKASVQLGMFLEGSLRRGNSAILSMRLGEPTVRTATTLKVSHRREEETRADHSDEQRRTLPLDEQIRLRDRDLTFQLGGSFTSGVVMRWMRARKSGVMRPTDWSL